MNNVVSLLGITGTPVDCSSYIPASSAGVNICKQSQTPLRKNWFKAPMNYVSELSVTRPLQGWPFHGTRGACMGLVLRPNKS
jgi:hypothetical protein